MPLLLVATFAFGGGTLPAQSFGFSDQVALNPDAAMDEFDDTHPVIATNSAGTWIVAWERAQAATTFNGGPHERDLYFMRTDASTPSWSGPTPLNTNALVDTGNDVELSLAYGGNDVWLAVWRSSDSLGDTVGGDSDILFARSTDDGVSWSDPAPLNSNAATDTGTDMFSDIATDGAGNWIAVWTSNENLNGAIGPDPDLLVARSSDDGASWSDPASLHPATAASPIAVHDNDFHPSIATDRAGRWVVAWELERATPHPNDPELMSFDVDLVASLSTNNGATWSDPSSLNSSAGEDDGGDFAPLVVVDNDKMFRAFWTTYDPFGDTLGFDSDLMSAQSIDGVVWTAMSPINPGSANDRAGDEGLSVAYRGATGEWLAVWASNDRFAPIRTVDEDILVMRSLDDGATWSTPLVLNSDAFDEADHDLNPAIATDGVGTWVVVWQSNGTFGDPLGADFDIMISISGALVSDFDGISVR